LPSDDSHPEHSFERDDPTRYSRTTGRRVHLAALVLVIALAAGFLVVFALRSRDATELARATEEARGTRVAVSATRVKAGAGTENVSLPGATAAWNETTIYARVNGYVAKWNADIGDLVRKGKVLAIIATPELDSELEAARARLRADRSEVKVREAALAFARTTYERWKDSPKGVVSDQEREAKKSDWESAVAQRHAADSRVDLDEAEVERLVSLTRFKEVTAPFDGTVTERRIDIGNLVTAGSTSNTSPLYKLTQDDPMRVFVDVPQALAGGVSVGMAATVSLKEGTGRKLQGRVTRTARSVDPVARTLKTEIDLPNTDGALVSGLYVQVEMGFPALDLMQIPAAAMIFRSGGPQVAVVAADGTVDFRSVQIARDQGGLLQLASGVAPGEVVALNLSSQIAAGDKVAVRLHDEADPAGTAGRPR